MADPSFLGKVLDLDKGWPDDWAEKTFLWVIGESVMEPLRVVFLGGATGPSAFGGNGGLADSSIAWKRTVQEKNRLLGGLQPVSAKTLALRMWVLLLGCLWYMSSQARQNTWSLHSLHRTMAVAVPQRSHVRAGAA